jgi:hypothetical protein
MRGAVGARKKPMVSGAEPNRTLPLRYLARSAVNVFLIAVLPAWLGMLGAPMWLFLAYAALAGSVLTLTENLHYAREVFSEPAMRDYALVRVAVVAVCGFIPFVLANALNR